MERTGEDTDRQREKPSSVSAVDGREKVSSWNKALFSLFLSGYGYDMNDEFMPHAEGEAC